MRGVKIWHCSMFSDPAVALSYRTCSIPGSICLIWVESWSQQILCCTWVVLWQKSRRKTVFLLVKSGKENLCPLLNTLCWLLCNNAQTLTFAQIFLAAGRTKSLPRGTIATGATNNTSFHFQSWDQRSEVKGFPGWDGFKHNSAVPNMDEPLHWKLQSQNIIKGSSLCSWRCCNQHQRREHCFCWWLQPLVWKEHLAMCDSTTQLKVLEECTDWIIWWQLQDHSP